MSDKVINIISTKPLDDNLVEKAVRDGIIIRNAPFINIKKSLTTETAYIIQKLGEKKINAVFTSMNAVEIVVEALDRAPDNMPEWDIYCLGGSSFTLIKKYWVYERIKGSGKNAAELAQRIIGDQADEVHFFCGNSRREELPALLAQENIKVNEYAGYETVLTPERIEQQYDGILFFSPSAADSFFSLNSVSPETVLFAIGHTTANTLKNFSTNTIICSGFPAKEQLLETVINHYKLQQTTIH